MGNLFEYTFQVKGCFADKTEVILKTNALQPIDIETSSEKL
jgi:hypothetical protein